MKYISIRWSFLCNRLADKFSLINYANKYKYMNIDTSKLINSIITIRFEDIQMEEKGRLAFKLRKIQ